MLWEWYQDSYMHTVSINIKYAIGSLAYFVTLVNFYNKLKRTLFCNIVI